MTPLVALHDSYRYPTAPALAGVTLAIEPGERGALGPPARGKSHLLSY
jgi:energy-coupling factor transporter ATP-binding protein EcfA2